MRKPYELLKLKRFYIPLCGLVYTLLFIHFTDPLYTRFTDAVVSGFRDGDVFLWNMHIFTSRIYQGLNPWYTDAICHPVGTGLVMHTYTVITGMADLLFRNPSLSLNMVTWLHFVLSGIGALLFFQSIVPNLPLAFIAGFVFAFCPYKMTHLFAGQYNLIMTAPIPFFILSFKKLFQKGGGGEEKCNRLRYVVICILLFLIQLSCDYYLTYYLLLYLSGYGIWRLLRIGEWRRRRILVVSAIAVAAGIIAVILLELCGVRQNGLYTSADLISYLVPSVYARVFGNEYVYYLRTAVIKGGPLENITETGIVLIGLFGWFLIRHRRSAIKHRLREQLFFIVLFTVFATPVVNVAGKAIGVLPSAVMHYIPFVNNFRVASRMTIMVMLLLPIPAFSTLLEGIRRFRGRWVPVVVYVLLFALLYIQYLPKTFPLVAPGDVPEVYHRLADCRDDGALLELPFGIEAGKDLELGKVNTSHMVYQMTHKKKILGGYIARLPETMLEFYRRYTFVMMLFELIRTGRRDMAPAEPDYAAAFIHDFNVRYIIIDPGYQKSAAGEYVLAAVDHLIRVRHEIEGYTLLELSKPSNIGRLMEQEPVEEKHTENKRFPLERISGTSTTGKRIRKGPMRELEEARNAIRIARENGADLRYPDLFFGAVTLLDSAQAAIKTEHERLPFLRNFAGAKEYLDSAIVKARESSAGVDYQCIKR